MTTNGHPTEPSRLASDAKGALERVCSGAGLDPPSRYYGPTFVDHVNDLEFHGLEGARRSVDLYKSVLPDMAIRVEEQAVEGDFVASRFVVMGTSYGRRVRFNGITLSRFEGGLIVEDWSITDTLGMLRQLGLWRSLLVGVRQWRALAAAARATGPAPASPSCPTASRRAQAPEATSL
jgi:predicted ester cyclase